MKKSPAFPAVSYSMIAFLGTHELHAPDDDHPTPPWPPQVHIEAAPVVSSVTATVSNYGYRSPDRTVALTGVSMKADTGRFALVGFDVALSALARDGGTHLRQPEPAQADTAVASYLDEKQMEDLERLGNGPAYRSPQS